MENVTYRDVVSKGFAIFLVSFLWGTGEGLSRAQNFSPVMKSTVKTEHVKVHVGQAVIRLDDSLTIEPFTVFFCFF